MSSDQPSIACAIAANHYRARPEHRQPTEHPLKRWQSPRDRHVYPPLALCHPRYPR